MKKEVKNILKEKLYECGKHKEKLLDAQAFLKKTMPLQVDEYKQIDKVTSSFIDQLNFRFSKLQDTLGESVFRAILIATKEDIKKMTFLDILNRLEELEVVNKNEWLKLREIRNEITHEYSFNQKEVVDGINKIYDTTKELIQIYEKILAFAKTKLKVE